MSWEARLQQAEETIVMAARLARSVSDEWGDDDSDTRGEGAARSEAAKIAAQTLLRIGRVVGVRERVVVSEAGREVGADLLPQKFVDVYGLLWDQTYGPRGGQGLGDANAGQARDGVGQGRQLRLTSSGHAVYRAGAVTKKDKSKRNVVADADAFKYKRAIDQRLKRITADISLFLDGGRESVVTGTKSCGVCRSFVGRDWRYCASCGKELSGC